VVPARKYLWSSSTTGSVYRDTDATDLLPAAIAAFGPELGPDLPCVEAFQRSDFAAPLAGHFVPADAPDPVTRTIRNWLLR